MTPDTSYSLGFIQGQRGNKFLENFFKHNMDYLNYQQGYAAGQAEAALELAKQSEEIQ